MTKLKLRTFVDDNIFRLEERFNKWTDNSNVDISTSYIVKDPETGNFILSVFYSSFRTFERLLLELLKEEETFKKGEKK